MIDRNSFVFYKAWREAIRDLPDDVRLDIYESVIEYGTSGKLPALNPMVELALRFIKMDIDRDEERSLLDEHLWEMLKKW